MKLKGKIAIIVLSVLLFMLVIPLVIIRFAPNDWGLGFCFILFFAICPILVISLSILAGTDLKRLFVVPIVIALLFPFCFAIAADNMIWELFVYSAVYLICGTLAMITTHYYLKNKKEKKDNDNEQMSIC